MATGAKDSVRPIRSQIVAVPNPAPVVHETPAIENIEPKKQGLEAARRCLENELWDAKDATQSAAYKALLITPVKSKREVLIEHLGYLAQSVAKAAGTGLLNYHGLAPAGHKEQDKQLEWAESQVTDVLIKYFPTINSNRFSKAGCGLPLKGKRFQQPRMLLPGGMHLAGSNRRSMVDSTHLSTVLTDTKHRRCSRDLAK